jgi:hypothetical protein
MKLSALFCRALVIVAAIIVMTAPQRAASGAEPDKRLSFEVDDGLNLNSFLRDGPVATHLLLRAGAHPRILVAFPAGNSGTGLWFSPSTKAVTWNIVERPQPIIAADERGRRLFGMTAEVSVKGAKDLYVKQALLSSVRVLRDYQVDGVFPAEVVTHPTVNNSTVTWARDRLDGEAGYRLSIEVVHGEVVRAEHFKAGDEDAIGLKITALSGEMPLAPIVGDDLFNASAADDLTARNALTFLSYREKYLAGSWRFDTYFGRDTLMSLRLLMPALTPAAVQSGLAAVLSRLSPQGEVAHEEGIGEFAVLEHLRSTGVRSDAPIFDYKMIDSSFMLAPVAAAWLLDDDRGRSEAAAFLAQMDERSGEAPRVLGADLVTNLKFVLRAAASFAQDPRASNLIALKSGFSVGEWRDSNTGLGGGRFPYDVNAVFVPSAVEAAGRFFASGLLDPYLAPADRGIFSRSQGMARIWRAKAGPLFDVDIPSATARGDIVRYAAALHVDPGAALHSVGDKAVRFHALSLTAEGRTLPIEHSDEGFAMLFGRPSAADLRRSVTAWIRPFPAGLLTDVGVVVANPVYARAAIQAQFTRNAYHGTVIWSWQQAVLAAGLQRQLRRPDLSSSLKKILLDAQTQLWGAIRSAQTMRNSELWSWTFVGGHFLIEPFGSSAADADESNAVQLWSTVYLAIPDPTLPKPVARQNP